jgi:hypothetical protein
MEPRFGIVAMLDALGVSNYSTQAAIDFSEQRNELIKNLEEQAPNTEKLFDAIYTQEIIDQIISNPGCPPKKNIFPKIEKAVFGDTIILCWPITPESETSREVKTWKVFPYIAILLRNIIISGLERGILFRGSISIGEYACEENTFLGPAITDAYAWSEEADWFGVILTPHCQIYLTYLLENEAEKETISKVEPTMKFENALCVKYCVPLHQGSKELFALSWPLPFLNTGHGSGKSGLVLLANLLLNKSIPKGTESKYENSINFFKWFEKEKYSELRDKFEKSRLSHLEKMAQIRAQMERDRTPKSCEQRTSKESND